MPRYEARVDLTGSATDANASLSSLADAADETTARIEDAFDQSSANVEGRLGDLAGKGDGTLSTLADSGEKSAGRLTEAFGESGDKINTGLSELAATAEEKSAVIAGAFERDFAAAGDSSAAMAAKVGESLDAVVAETTEKSALIAAKLDSTFAKGALASRQLTANTGRLSAIGQLGEQGTLTGEEVAAARAQALGSLRGNLQSRLGQLGALKSGGLISDAEYAAAKAKIVGLSATAETETKGVADRIGGLFKSAGSSLSNWGVPFTGSLEKMGDSIQSANTKGGKLKETLSSIGKITVVGGVSGALAVAAESLHLADEYETTLAALRTAVKNTGTSWAAYQGQLKKAQDQGASLGFNISDTTRALQILTTATNKPKTALADMGLVEDLARQKNISLSESAETIAKVYAGSARPLTQLGINLDIGSGKLHSVQQAQEALQKAELAEADAAKAVGQAHIASSQQATQAMLTERAAATALAESHVSGSNAVANALESQKVTQAEVASGQLRGASAVGALQKSQMALTEAVENSSLHGQAAQIAYERAQAEVSASTEKSSYAQVAALDRLSAAQLTVKDDALNLKQSQGAIATVLKTVDERVHGAADTYGKTLPGQMRIAEAELEKLGTNFGEDLTPKVEEAAKALSSVLGWFEKNTGAAKALGLTIGGVLGVAVAVFAEQKAVKFAKSVGNMLGDLHKLEQGVVSVGKKLLGLGASETPAGAQPADQVAQTGDASESAATQVSGLGQASAEAQASLSSLGATAEEAATSISALGPEAETTGATVVAGMDAAEAGTESAAGGIDAAIGSTGIGLLLIGLSIGVTELVKHWRGAWTGIKVAAEATWHFLDSEVVHPIEHGFDWLRGEIKSHLSEIEHYAKEFGPAVLVMLGPIGLIAGAAIELVTHWKTVWGTIDRDIIQPVERGVDRLLGDLKTDWHTLESDVTHLWSTVSGDVVAGAQLVVRDVEKLPGEIEHLFSEAGTWLLDAGEDLLKGLWKGIDHETGKVFHDVEGVGKKVLHYLSHPWDILSPSKATAQHGVYLMQGVSVGITAELPSTLSKADQAGRLVIRSFAAGLTQEQAFLAATLRSVVEKALQPSALRSVLTEQLRSATTAAGLPLTTASGHPYAPGSSVVNQFVLSNARIVANDPAQLGKQLQLQAKRKNLVRT